MRPTSARFDPSQSHKPVSRVSLVSTGEEVPILSGSVTLNSKAEVRGVCDLRVEPDQAWVPTTADSSLAPVSTEVQIERGIEYLDGTAELVSLGIYGLQQTQISDSGDDLGIQVAGLDRAKKFVDAQFEEPYGVASGTNAITAISDVLLAAFPDTETDFPATTHTTPLLAAQEGENRWGFAQGLATWLGAELYFDGDGVAVITPVAQSLTSVLTISEGDSGLLLSIDADWDRELAFNRVVVTGENPDETGTIPRGVATDDDPESPTYYYSAFGRKPMFYASEFVTSNNQAADAAAALLAKNLGIGKTISFGSIVHPALEPLDAITVTRERAGISQEVLTLDSLTIPLDFDGSMSGTTRTVRVTS